MVELSEKSKVNENKPERSGWRQYEDSSVGGVIKSSYDQKVYLLDINLQRLDFNNVLTLATKELDTSFINDMQLKYLYQVQFENILEWASMGLFPLAKLRLSKMFGEFKIEKSVGGMENILQHTEGLSGSLIATLPASRTIFSPVQIGRKSQQKRTILDRVTGGNGE